MTSSKSRGQAGFTLLEAIVALGLTAFILTSVANLFTRASFESKRAREDTRSAELVASRLEALLRLPLTASDWNAGEHDQAAADGYTLHWFVSVNAPGPGARTVAMSATRTRSSRSVRMVAVRGR